MRLTARVALGTASSGASASQGTPAAAASAAAAAASDAAAATSASDAASSPAICSASPGRTCPVGSVCRAPRSQSATGEYGVFSVGSWIGLG